MPGKLFLYLLNGLYKWLVYFHTKKRNERLDYLATHFSLQIKLENMISSYNQISHFY